MAEATRAIVDAANQKGPERVVMLSSFAVARDRLTPVTKLVNGIAMGSQIKDETAGEEVLRASSVDWTNVYATKLTNGPKTEARVVPESEKVGMSQKISRAGVASFLLQAATEDLSGRSASSSPDDTAVRQIGISSLEPSSGLEPETPSLPWSGGAAPCYPALETDQSQPGSARLRAGTADGAIADSSRLPRAESSWSEPQHEQARSTAGSGPPRPRHNCWLPPPTPLRCQAAWAGLAGLRGLLGTGAPAPCPSVLGPAGHTQDHAAKPCGKNQVLAVPAEHAERFEGASLARIWRTTPASAARLAPPTCRRCRLWAMRRAAAARPGLVCEGVSDGLVGQSSFQFVSAAPVIGHSAAYRCR
jgi:hypothetical protein